MDDRSDDTERKIRREARRQRALERLGVASPKCIYCDENDPLVLEKHHVAGRAFHDDTVITCRNHHRVLSDFQKDHPARIYEKPCELEIIAHYLAGLADFFELLVRTLREFVKYLIGKADENAGNNEGAL